MQTFSHPNPFPAPYHPYLHTNGAATHPVILILNALLAYKRVMFLGYGLPANQVARIVLAACALVSGCGQVLRGFTECAFPYANLASLDILEEFNGFVAGVTNPRFEELPMTWDVLCNLETGKVTVSKDLRTSVSTMRQASDSSLGSMVKIEEDTQGGTPQSKMNSSSKADCLDNQFMDDVSHITLARLTIDPCGYSGPLWRSAHPPPIHRLPRAFRPARRLSGVHAHGIHQDWVPVCTLPRRGSREWGGIHR